MALIDRLKETLGSSGAEEGRQRFRYHCRECGLNFEAEATSRSDVTCPDCGASGPRSISKL